MDMKEIEQVLTTLMRGIDKKVALTVGVSEEADAARVSVRLSRDKRVGMLEISEDDLVASKSDLIRRNRVRTQLKRARDRMWEQTTYIFSTKVEHVKPEGANFFRQSPHGRGRR
jgi:hypothetical protein